jgi:hypothetical protein
MKDGWGRLDDFESSCVPRLQSRVRQPLSGFEFTGATYLAVCARVGLLIRSHLLRSSERHLWRVAQAMSEFEVSGAGCAIFEFSGGPRVRC